jgi:SAM-dependent methyltransferase
MDEICYHQARELEDTYWWFVGKRMCIDRFIPWGKVLSAVDLGCGTGSTIGYLQKRIKRVVGIDMNPFALAYSRQRGIVKLIRCDSSAIALKDRSADLVIASELLEHVQDECLTLQEIHRVLIAGGRVIITVPAFRFLWGAHDEVSHHLRRYTHASLKKVCSDSGFRVLRISYLHFSIFIPALLIRTFKRISRGRSLGGSDFCRVPACINWAMIKIYALESLFLSRHSFPFGASLIGVLEKI